MEKQIYLCGCVHFDLEGPRRLRNVLKKVSPDVIAVEYDKRGYKEAINDHRSYLRNMEKLQSDLKTADNKINKRLVKKFYSSINYEAWVLHEYLRRHKTKIVFLEDDKLINSILNNEDVHSHVGDLLDLLKLKINDFQREMDRIYKRREIDKSDEFKLMRRNKIFANKIKKLKGNVLALVGINHLKGKNSNLKILLKKYKLKIISLLNDN